MSKVIGPSTNVYIEHLLNPAGITEVRGDVFKSTWTWNKPTEQIVVDFHPTDLDPNTVRWRIPDQMLVDYLSYGEPVSDDIETIHFYPLIRPTRSHSRDNLQERYGKQRLERTMGIILVGGLDNGPATIHLAVNPKKLIIIGDAIGGLALGNEADTPHKIN